MEVTAPTSPSARQGSGLFQWNLGGWFGSQVGSTLWLVLMGALLLPVDLKPALGVLVCGLVPNVIGTWLWTKRFSIAPYPALQLLLALIATSALSAFLLLDYAGLMQHEWNGTSWPGNWGYFNLLIFPALMGVFHLRERAARGTRA